MAIAVAQCADNTLENDIVPSHRDEVLAPYRHLRESASNITTKY